MDPGDSRLNLGVEAMDSVHREFVELVNAMVEARQRHFLELFDRFAEHTAAHFDNEDRLMVESGFPALQEHRSEHRRVLGDLGAIARRSTRAKLAMGRVYVREQLPAWFSLHAVTMDSALAAHLKAVSDTHR
jgi:hemerythrin-like metal-binding protein